MLDAKCKICRRLGAKLFLKGERCLSPKCPMIRKPYPPGVRGKRRTRRALSEYRYELREKQKLKNWYNLKEAQFQRYAKEILAKKGEVEDPASLLIRKLELRTDNVVYRLGWATSRPQARQAISHGHFLINGKPSNIPSRILQLGEIIKIHPSSLNKFMFRDLSTKLKKYKPPGWLELNVQKMEGKVKNLPTLEEVAPPVGLSAIFEFYSR